MTNDDERLSRLYGLRDQVDALAKKQRLCDEFQSWHRHFIGAVEDCFEKGSQEHTEARALQFELPPELFDVAKNGLERLSSNQSNTDAALDELQTSFERIVEEQQQNHYRKTLSHARELISAMILIQRQAP